MPRHCVCGKVITATSRLCNDCLSKYGSDPSKWEKWVKFLVDDEQKEINRARRHRESTYNDETANIDLSDRAAHNLKRARHDPEMDFEQFLWFNQ